MRKLFVFAAIVPFILTVACTSKKIGWPIHPIDPPDGYIPGKWAFKSSVGTDVLHEGLGSSLFTDTLIFTADHNYFMIDNGDTVNRGSYSIGHGEAINGFGITQAYDSIKYTTNSIAQSAVYPAVFYFKLHKNSLSCSLQYYKDSSRPKTYINYTRKLIAWPL